MDTFIGLYEPCGKYREYAAINITV